MANAEFCVKRLWGESTVNNGSSKSFTHVNIYTKKLCQMGGKLKPKQGTHARCKSNVIAQLQSSGIPLFRSFPEMLYP